MLGDKAFKHLFLGVLPIMLFYELLRRFTNPETGDIGQFRYLVVDFSERLRDLSG